MPRNHPEDFLKRRSMLNRAGTAALTAALAILFTACTPSGTPEAPRTETPASSPAAAPPSSASSSPTTPATTAAPATPTPSATPKPRPTAKPGVPASPEQVLATLSLEKRVGQLFMVGAKASGSDSEAVAGLLGRTVGNFYLSGRSRSGVEATASLVASLRAAAAKSGNKVPVSVATDQEGGLVQVLRGPGFSEIPTALNQAALAPAQLRAQARTWGAELRKAGVNVNLAPVLDTVPSAVFAPSNAPIGYFQREYGYTPSSVSAHGNAMASGLRDAGVAPVVKHYPGLGRVTLNTDVSGSVHDTATTRTDPYLAPFTAAIRGGTRWVMVANAYYDRIDATHPAPFSSVIMRTMLRADAGFTGIIVSDDLCNAAQLAPWGVGERAANFVAAGGTMVLCADAASVPAMYAEVLRRATAEPAFREAVDAAALTVLRVKAGG